MKKIIFIKKVILIIAIFFVILSIDILKAFSSISKFDNNKDGINSKDSINLVNGAINIDTQGYEFYNSSLYDFITNKYYIVGYQLNQTMKLLLISINPDLTLNYSKYYEVKENSKDVIVGLSNLWYKDNTKFYVSGKIGFSGEEYGIIGEVNKNTGQITLKKILKDVGSCNIISYANKLYLISQKGHVLKLDSNYNILSSKQLSSSGFVTLSISQNYLITYDYINGGVVVLDKNLNNSYKFNNYIMHAPLVDNTNNLYYIDRKSGNHNLVLVKTNINNLNNLANSNMIKEYNFNSISDLNQIGFSFDKNILLAITTSEKNKNLVLLKINKNDFSIMNQIKLSSKIGGSSQVWGDLNIMFLPDEGFFINGIIDNINFSNGSVGYILKGPRDLNIANNCVFTVSNPGITEVSFTNYKINVTNLKLRDVDIKEIPVKKYTLVEKSIKTFVGCKTSVRK